MNLDDLIQEHSRQAAEIDGLGEIATWHQVREGKDVPVRVVVDRMLLEEMNSIGGVAAAVQSAKVFLPRYYVKRVWPGDQITLRMRIGGDLERCRIAEILSEDVGGFSLLVQR